MCTPQLWNRGKTPNNDHQILRQILAREADNKYKSISLLTYTILVLVGTLLFLLPTANEVAES